MNRCKRLTVLLVTGVVCGGVTWACHLDLVAAALGAAFGSAGMAIVDELWPAHGGA